MSFQYLDNIQDKTGKSPDDFRKLAAKLGFTEGGTLRAGVKAGVVVEWLKADYALGHGHALAIVALLKVKQGAGRQRPKLHSTRAEVPSVKRT